MTQVSLLTSPSPLLTGLLLLLCYERLVDIDHINSLLWHLASCWIPPFRTPAGNQKQGEDREEGEDHYCLGFSLGHSLRMAFFLSWKPALQPSLSCSTLLPPPFRPVGGRASRVLQAPCTDSLVPPLYATFIFLNSPFASKPSLNYHNFSESCQDPK